MSFEKIKQEILELYPSVSVEMKNGCVSLSGALDDWGDIVDAGVRAVKIKSKGVLNDIRLIGFSENISIPDVRDSSLHGQKPDVLIIGGGIIGCAVARELSKLNLNTFLVEKAADVALHTSSRNDGCVHVGIDLKKGQQKLKYCHLGNKMFDTMCSDLNVEFKRYGQTIIFSKNWENILLAAAMRIQAKILGVWGVKHLSKKQLSEIEPSPPRWAKGAMHFTSGGVVSPYKLTIALAENAAMNGVKFFFDTIVEGMELSENKDKIVAVKTNRGTIYPKLVVNCAGVFSDVIAQMANDRTFTIHPRKGTNLILDKKKINYAKSSVARSPFAKPPKQFREKEIGRIAHTKGGGIVRTIDNNILVGPNAVEQPYREDYTTSKDEIDRILKKHSLVSKDLCHADVITYFSGTRAATYEEDFVVREGVTTKNIFEAAGIQSPGITAAPAIACEIREWAKKVLNSSDNKNFNPVRKGIPHLSAMKDEERNALIKKNPDYGEIVCRCEEVSKGEIIDAINNPLGVVSIDAIKRRVRPGMGRCQGGFCSPLIVGIIAEQKKIAPEKVKKSGSGSELLFTNTKQPELKNSNDAILKTEGGKSASEESKAETAKSKAEVKDAADIDNAEKPKKKAKSSTNAKNGGAQ